MKEIDNSTALDKVECNPFTVSQKELNDNL